MINKIFVSGGSQCIGGGFINDDVKKAYNEKFNIKIDNKNINKKMCKLTNFVSFLN